MRRRARRRLVGAVALALLAVVVLPMVFDPEPRPMGDQVKIEIPDQQTPFVPEAVPTPVPAPVVESAPAPEVMPDNAPPAVMPEPVAVKPEPVEKPAPVVKPVPETRAKPADKPASKLQPATAKPEPKPKAENKPGVEDKPEVAKPAASAGAYYLQLGVFSSQANAEQLLGKAKAAGFKAASVKVGGQYKVRVGPIAERAQALDFQAKLKSRGLNNVLVEP